MHILFRIRNRHLFVQRWSMINLATCDHNLPAQTFAHVTFTDLIDSNSYGQPIVLEWTNSFGCGFRSFCILHVLRLDVNPICSSRCKQATLQLTLSLLLRPTFCSSIECRLDQQYSMSHHLTEISHKPVFNHIAKTALVKYYSLQDDFAGFNLQSQ